jgi:cytochrome P450
MSLSCDHHRESNFEDPAPNHETYGELIKHWERVRRTEPIAWSQKMNAWLVTSHSHAMEAYHHPDLTTFAYDQFRPSPIPLPSSFEIDSADHLKLQHAIASCIGRHVLPVDMIKRECRQYLADIPDRKIIDVAQEFSEPVAKVITQQWFGLSEYAINTILALSQEAAFGEHEKTRLAAKNLIVEQLNSLIDERRYNPGPDLISQLAVAWSKFKLDDRWLVAFVGPMFHSLATGIGGRLITHTALHLKDQPALQDVVRDGGWETARLAALETARIDPVNQGSPRRATQPLSLGGQRINHNDLVWIVLPAVCRDPEAYPDPHQFRLNRAGRSLAFGHGAHVCTGRELALAIAATAISELLTSRRLRPGSEQAKPLFRIDFGRACVRLPALLEAR